MINPGYKYAITKDPIFATRGIRDSRIVKVLDLMLYGAPIKLGDYAYEMVETDMGGFMPIALINEEERLIQGMPDLSLMDFSLMVAEIPDEEFDAWFAMHDGTRRLCDKLSVKAKRIRRERREEVGL